MRWRPEVSRRGAGTRRRQEGALAPGVPPKIENKTTAFGVASSLARRPQLLLTDHPGANICGAFFPGACAARLHAVATSWLGSDAGSVSQDGDTAGQRAYSVLMTTKQENRGRKAGVNEPGKFGREFFEQGAKELAPALVGVIMVRRVRRRVLRARIVETEAYLGPRDLASHSAKGRTARTEVMFGPAGHAYVYFVYGMHWMFNIVSGVTGEAEAVLVRAAEPLDGWEVDLTGPAKLAKAFGIARAENGLDLTGEEIYFVADSAYRPRILKAKRVGVDYSKHWKERLLRFIDVGSPVAKKLKW